MKTFNFDSPTDYNLFVGGEGMGMSKQSGRYPVSSLAGCDGPFAKIQNAIDIVRYMNMPGSVTIWLHGGRYELDKPLSFTEADVNPITIRSYPGEQAVLDGGKRITEWEETELHGKRALVAQLEPGQDFHQLFVNDRRAKRTRVPEQGVFRMKYVPKVDLDKWMDVQAHCTDCFYADPADFGDWKNIDSTEVIVVHYWNEERMPVVSYDRETGFVQCSLTSYWPLRDDAHGGYARYWVENVFEALKNEGEYYYDKSDGKLWYLPFPNENADNVEAYVPGLVTMVTVTGNEEKQQKAQGIRFEDVTFMNCDYTYDMYRTKKTPNRFITAEYKLNRAGDGQACYTHPAMIEFTYARNCAIENCTIKHGGHYGINVNEGCTGIRISGNTITDMGGGGVKINGVEDNCGLFYRTGMTLVADNTICDSGHIFLSAIGVLITHSAHNVVVHNHIHHLRYSGVSCGWIWGFATSASHDNKIEKNHIHHLGLKTINDMGGIYMLGVQPGTTIRNNVIHDVQKVNYGGWGVYLDEGSSNMLVENNICYHNDTEGFHQHFGRENLIRNNIFALNDTGEATLSRMEAHISDNFIHNLFVSKNRPCVTSGHPEMWTEGHIFSDANLFWNYSGEVWFGKPTSEPTEEDKLFTFDNLREMGFEYNSVVADPLFKDPENGDFSMPETSPAYKLGFKPIDVSDVGPRPIGERDNTEYLPTVAGDLSANRRFL